MKTLDCGHKPSPHSSFTTGYGTDATGKTHCYACCAARDKAGMIETGRATLYLIGRDVPPEGNEAAGFATRGSGFSKEDRTKLKRWYLTNWPGSLSFPVRFMRQGAHNMARVRYDAWFTGPDGKNWHAVQYGDNTQIAHCRRIK